MNVPTLQPEEPAAMPSVRDVLIAHQNDGSSGSSQKETSSVEDRAFQCPYEPSKKETAWVASARAFVITSCNECHFQAVQESIAHSRNAHNSYVIRARMVRRARREYVAQWPSRVEFVPLCSAGASVGRNRTSSVCDRPHDLWTQCLRPCVLCSL